MYTFKTSTRARHLSISVRAGGEVVVTVPTHMSAVQADAFVQKKRDWIEKKVKLMEKYSPQVKMKLSKKEVTILKQKARALVEQKFPQFNKHYKYSWNTIAIRGQKTRWGSCSKKGNLNFNYKIALLPENLADYIVVHELCHLGEFNHSERFWALVAQAVPDYAQRRKELKYLGMSLG